MNSRTLARRSTAAGGVLALVATALLGAAPIAHADPAVPAPGAARAAADYPAPTHGDTIDFFDDAYDALGPDSVFETVTFERFEYLLKKPTGKFAFVVGGPEDADLQRTIGHIDAVAKAEGIEKVYNFDPNLDGDALSVFDLTGYDLATADNAGKDQFLDLGERLVTSYLGKDAQTPFTLAADATKPDQRVAPTHPYLFVYDASGGETDRIVDALVTPPTDLSSPSATTAYRAEVKRVLTSVTLDVDTQWDFLSSEHNRRHFERYVRNADPAVQAANLRRFGGDIFDAATDLTDGDEDDFRIENITYPELIDVLDSDGDFVILFGGTWCHNTAAIIKQTAQLAREHGVRKVYNFDFSLDSTGNGGTLDKHIRDNAFRTVGGQSLQTRPSFLYGEILERLGNASTQYRITDTEAGSQSVSPVRYYEDGVVPEPATPAVGEKLARKIQVGHLLSYSKGRQVGGQAAPVVDQAIRSSWTNPDGGTFAGNLEYMTEWWYTLGKDAVFDAADPDHLRGSVNVAAAAGQNSLQNQRNFAREAIRDVGDVIAGVSGGYDSEVTASGLPASVAVGQQTPLSAQVAVASDFDGFYSDRTAGPTTAPLTGDRPLGGTVEVFVDATRVAQADLTPGRTAALAGTIPALAAGAHELRVVYSGGQGGLVQATELTQPLDIAANASTVTLAEPSRLSHGTVGRLTAAVTPGATGTVRLVGLPGGDVDGTIVDGTATFAVPAATPAGRYTVTASYGGDATNASSTSAPLDVVVAKALTIVQVASSTVAYGKGGALTVKVVSPAGVAVSGPVTLTGVGVAQTRQLAGGSATFTLPRGLAPAKYSARFTYGGTSDLGASLSQVSYTIAKGVPGRPTATPVKALKAGKAGRLKVSVPTAAGLAKASGRVTVTLSKGAQKRVLRGVLKPNGVVQVATPKLAKGTWKAVVVYGGDASYVSARSAVAKLVVRK
ncbi:Ig-like domain repeat protein [Nocardioides sp. C4-1]|uniref:Ig-like domain repeat protein n=1 Tax=Nocardioides sp. C4-1 TaxID=3151851 RepID=UPI00326443A6